MPSSAAHQSLESSAKTDSPKTPASLSSRTIWAILALIVLWGLFGAGWFASSGLDSTKEWDERYVLENVKPVLTGRGLRHVNGWYPRLSYLPQIPLLKLSQAYSEATGDETFSVFTPDGKFSPAAYLICRWLNTVFGAGCLIVTFLIGRRMFTPIVGLLAAFLQSVAPWHIVAAGVFKPDPSLLLLTSLVVYWSLAAIERGTLRTYLLCGAGIGLAASAKTSGAFASIPLVTLSLLEPLRRSRWLLLVLAGSASIVVFILVNGDLLYYLNFAREEQESLITNRPAQSFLSMLLWIAEMPTYGTFHGRFFGALALLGLAGFAVLLVRRWHQPAQRAQLAVFLSFPVGYSLLVSVLSDYKKDNHLLPLVPFTAIAAGWILAWAWKLTAGRLAVRRQRLLVLPAVAALVLLAGAEGWTYVYGGGAPMTTLSWAARLIEYKTPFLNHRLAIYEADGEETLRVTKPGAWSRATVVEQREAALSDVATFELDRADFEIFDEERLHGPNREFYVDRMLRLDPGQATILEPNLLKIRGSSKVLLMHAWHLIRPTLPVEWSGRGREKRRRSTARLPAEIEAGEMISLDLAFKNVSGPSTLVRDCRLTLDREPLELFRYQVAGGEERWMTRRLRVSRARAAARLRCAEGSGHQERLSAFEVARWSATPLDLP